MNLSRSFFFLTVGLLLFCGLSSAEEERKKITDILTFPVKTILSPLNTIGLADIVTKPLDAAADIADLGEVVVTPGRTEEYSSNINKNISVITSETILNENPQKIQDLLSQRAGIVSEGFMNTAKDNNLSMRGYGETGLSNYVVLIDGRRTNQIDLSGVDLSQIDINSIDRIEIIRGANSVLYGDNATGGVINIITKKGKTKDKIEYTQKYGSFGYWKEYVSAGGSHDFLDYFTSYSYQNTDGFRLNGGYEANDIFSSFTVKPCDSFNIDISSNYHKDWYGQPGALYLDNIKNIGREGSRFPNDKAKTEDFYFLVDPKLSAELESSEIVLSCLSSYRLRRVNSVSKASSVYESNHHIGSLDFRPKAEINSSFLADRLENKVVIGTDLFYAKDQILSGDTAFTKSQLDVTKKTLGIYASDNLLLDKRYIVNGGIRGEWAEFSFDQSQPTTSVNSRSPREIAFDAGLGYKYNDRSQIYANYARSYRFPTTDEFFQSAYEYLNWWTGAVTVFPAVLNTDLKQQVGNNYEVGIKDNSFSFLDISTCYYLIDNKNEIYYDPITYTNTNYHHTIHHGLELEARANCFEKISPFLSYTFEKSFFVGGIYAGKKMPLVPENKISSGIDLKPLKEMTINYTINYVGPMYMASDQTNSAPRLKEYMTMDLNIFFDVGNFRIFGSIKNICDSMYYSNGTKDWLGNAAFYTAPGRSFEGGVTVTF